MRAPTRAVLPALLALALTAPTSAFAIFPASAAPGAPPAPEVGAGDPPGTTRAELPPWPAAWTLAASAASGADTLPRAPQAGAWGGPRARELVRAVAAARARHPYGDTTLRSFRARAEGHTYFLFDPGPAAALLGASGGERLARVDQLALEIAWELPGHSRQTVVGRRSERLLPSRIRYHADHLRVLLESFGGTISLSRGTEVRSVPHPASPGAPSTYEYRLVDSLEVRLAGERRRLYRLQVRPRESGRPAVVGEMFVDGDEPALARLAVTFTPSSYRDPQLEHVAVDLESGLIDGRYWLPVRQTTQVHRQATWLDVPAGGTIRTEFRVRDYRLNPEDPVRLLPGEQLVSLADSVLAAYDGWERGLYEGPGPGGAAPGPGLDLEEVRDRARRLVARRRLSGLAPARLYLPDASHALRVRRGEGVLAGAGVRTRDTGWHASLWAGHPFGSERPEARAELTSSGSSGPSLTACLRCLADVGPFPASSGVAATVSALAGGGDYRDPWFRTGMTASWRLPLAGGGLVRVSGGWEQHGSASEVPGPQSGPDARPVRPIREGVGALAEAEAEVPLGGALGARWRARVAAEGATTALGDFGYGRALLRLEGDSPPPAEQAVSWHARLAAGAGSGRLPPQRLFLLGGRGTVPGYDFRAWGGDRFALAELGAAADVAAPWIRVRARFTAGWTGIGGTGREAADRLGVEESGGIRPAVGAGVGLLWDLLRVHADRGLRDGRWTLDVFLDPGFWPVL